jgi:hypothetical protein
VVGREARVHVWGICIVGQLRRLHGNDREARVVSHKSM